MFSLFSSPQNKNCRFCGVARMEKKEYCHFFNKHTIEPLILVHNRFSALNVVGDIIKRIIHLMIQLERTPCCVMKRLGRLKAYSDFNKKKIPPLLQESVNYKLTLEELNWSIKVTKTDRTGTLIDITHLDKFLL